MTEDEKPAAPDLAEETRKIVGAVQDWMRRSAAATAGADGIGVTEQLHTGNDCQWCPICQFAAVLRGERPDVSDKLAEAGTAIAAALKSLVDAAAAHVPEAAGPAVPGHSESGSERRTGPAASSKRRPSPRVQHIDLDGVDG